MKLELIENFESQTLLVNGKSEAELSECEQQNVYVAILDWLKTKRPYDDFAYFLAQILHFFSQCHVDYKSFDNYTYNYTLEIPEPQTIRVSVDDILPKPNAVIENGRKYSEGCVAKMKQILEEDAKRALSGGKQIFKEETKRKLMDEKHPLAVAVPITETGATTEELLGYYAGNKPFEVPPIAD